MEGNGKKGAVQLKILCFPQNQPAKEQNHDLKRKDLTIYY